MFQLICTLGNIDTQMLGEPSALGVPYTWYWYAPQHRFELSDAPPTNRIAFDVLVGT